MYRLILAEAPAQKEPKGTGQQSEAEPKRERKEETGVLEFLPRPQPWSPELSLALGMSTTLQIMGDTKE